MDRQLQSGVLQVVVGRSLRGYGRSGRNPDAKCEGSGGAVQGRVPRRDEHKLSTDKEWVMCVFLLLRLGRSHSRQRKLLWHKKGPGGLGGQSEFCIAGGQGARLGGRGGM